MRSRAWAGGRDRWAPVAAGAAGVVAAGAMVSSSAGRTEPPARVILGVALIAVLAAGPVLARIAPTGQGLACLGAYAGYVAAGLPDVGVEVLLVAALFVAGLRAGRSGLWRLGPPGFLTGLATALATAPAGARVAGVSSAAVVGTLVVVPLTGGVLVRQLQDTAAELAAKADHLRRFAELERSEGVAQERARIARELHDIVAHRLSAISIQARAGAILVGADDDAARRAFDAVAEQAGYGVGEMHGLLRALRGRQVPSGGPLIGDVEHLVAAEASVGTDIRVDGLAEAALLALPPEVSTTAYRVVQEALSNVRRHAPHSRVTIAFAVAVGRLEVLVTNGEGRAASQQPGGHLGAGVGAGGGYGLVGMRERVEQVGGSVTAGPVDGGWAVRAYVPLGDAAAVGHAEPA